MDIEFDFIVEGTERPDADRLLTGYELDMLFEHTRQQTRKEFTRKLDGMMCDEHGEPPHVKVTGTYNAETEDMDVAYHIDTCCKLFLARIIKTLNQVN